jgi:maltodextrin utilization protein YvdJ
MMMRVLQLVLRVMKKMILMMNKTVQFFFFKYFYASLSLFIEWQANPSLPEVDLDETEIEDGHKEMQSLL